MFTGLVEQVGSLVSAKSPGEGGTLTVRHDPWDVPLKDGESIAVQGCCLTAKRLAENHFCCDVLIETLAKTNLGEKGQGSSVNLERALRVGDRFGGHIVSGHIDGTGIVRQLNRVGRDRLLEIESVPAILQHFVPKGSVCCDGVSLTLTSVSDSTFKVHLIPHTWEQTSLCQLELGSTVNIEVDMMAKYAKKFMVQDQAPPSSLSIEDLRRAGFV